MSQAESSAFDHEFCGSSLSSSWGHHLDFRPSYKVCSFGGGGGGGGDKDSASLVDDGMP